MRPISPQPITPMPTRSLAPSTRDVESVVVSATRLMNSRLFIRTVDDWRIVVVLGLNSKSLARGALRSQESSYKLVAHDAPEDS
jgi:hypothetical protein